MRMFSFSGGKKRDSCFKREGLNEPYDTLITSSCGKSNDRHDDYCDQRTDD